jgi:hypothetical protein
LSYFFHQAVDQCDSSDSISRFFQLQTKTVINNPILAFASSSSSAFDAQANISFYATGCFLCVRCAVARLIWLIRSVLFFVVERWAYTQEANALHFFLFRLYPAMNLYFVCIFFFIKYQGHKRICSMYPAKRERTRGLIKLSANAHKSGLYLIWERLCQFLTRETLSWSCRSKIIADWGVEPTNIDLTCAAKQFPPTRAAEIIWY